MNYYCSLSQRKLSEHDLALLCAKEAIKGVFRRLGARAEARLIMPVVQELHTNDTQRCIQIRGTLRAGRAISAVDITTTYKVHGERVELQTSSVVLNDHLVQRLVWDAGLFNIS